MSEKSNKLGRYEILEQIGKGGMGVVVKAYDPKVDRIVAIKTIKKAEISEPEMEEEMLERFYLEAKATAKLNHPNIVTLFDMGDSEEVTYIVMEYIDGGTWNSLVNKQPALDEVTVLKYMRQVAAGLDFAHSKGILHRDIKPANIMISADGISKIADFGLARLTETASRITSTGRGAVGSPSYMSPEQIQELELDARTDQYSFGVVFYELVTNTRPFTGNSLSSIIYKIVRDNPVPPTVHNPRLYPAVDDVVMKVLSKNPKSRYSSCTEFVDELEKAVKGLVTSKPDKGYDKSDISTLIAGRHPPIPPTPKPGAAWKTIAALLIVAVAGAGYYFFGQKRIDEKEKVQISQTTPAPAPKVKNAQPPIAEKKAPEPKPTLKKVAATAAPKEATRKPQPKIPPSGFISINANSQAEIFIDGEFVGHGPLKKRKVPAGSHTLLVKREGYKNWKKEIRIAKNEVYSIKHNAALITGSLQITGPTGAKVFLNDREIGTVPLSNNILPGKYELKLTKTGYQSFNKNIQIRANQSFKEEITLNFEEQIASLPSEGLQSGSKAPNIIGRTLDGKIFQLYKSEAKLKVITFWSINSNPSKIAIQELAQLEKRYPDIEFVTVHSFDAKKENVSAIINRLSEKPSTVVLGKKRVKEIYQFESFPHTVVVDYRNKVLSTITGHSETNLVRIERIIEKSL